MNRGQIHQNVVLETTPAPLPFAAARDANPPETVRPKLSIAELENIARRHNPTLAQAARQIEALRGKYVQQGLYPNPVIGYLGEEIGDDGQGGQARRLHRPRDCHGGQAEAQSGRGATKSPWPDASGRFNA